MDQAAVDTEISRLELSEQIRVACINSPESVTVSGNLSAIEKITGCLQTVGAFVRRLKTNGNAY
jgi:acyl transferase domain-containing protein